ncbi:hypothetical protein [Nocardia sp. NPDC050175]|uniref:hypothetical protein n=1 Tax=Nocardia sp. NPDC050175 TaxID=3364317 RepID=UPI0037A6FC97
MGTSDVIGGSDVSGGSAVIGGSGTGVVSNGSVIGAAGSCASVGGTGSNGAIGGSRGVVSAPGVLEPGSTGAASPVVVGTAGTRSVDWSLVGSGRLIESADESPVVFGCAVVCAADPEISSPATTTNDPVIGPDLRMVRAASHHFPSSS